MRRRAHKRYTKRLETEFTVGDTTRRGISSDLSERGLFVRSRHCLPPGSPLELTIYLPDDTPARVRGIVRRIVRDVTKIGMGVEVTDYDEAYRQFLETVLEGGVETPLSGSAGGAAERTSAISPDETSPRHADPLTILTCPACGVKNKVPTDKLSLGPRCGKCKEPLPAS